MSIPSDEDAVRMHPLSDAEELAYFAAAEAIIHKERNPWNAKKCAERYTAIRDLCRLMLHQGCRPEELMALQASHVDLARGTLRIIAGKSKAAKRTLKLTAEAKSIIARRLAMGAAYVFPGKKEGTHATKLNNAHEQVVKLSGVECVIYDFRHTFATRCAERGMPVATLAAILGHNDLRSVQKYVHVRRAAMDEAMVRFGEPATLTLAAGAVQ